MNKLVFLVSCVIAILFLIPFTNASTTVCDVPVEGDICCSDYTSDFRWPSGTGLCCDGMPYTTSNIYCSSSEIECSSVLCPSNCAGNIANSNGWCSGGDCSYYTFDCDSLDICVDDDYVNYYCGSGNCLPAVDSCTDCDCVDDLGVQQICGGYNIEESVFEDNCYDGKDNDCDGFCDSLGCDGKPRDPKCGLRIDTFQDVVDYCVYNSATRTYNCSVDANGDVWDNIYIANSISLPQDSGNSRHIIFEAKNEFISKTISAVGGSYDRSSGHSGGKISITASNITVLGSINTYGTYCCSAGCCSDSYCRSGGNGNTILLNSENKIDITGALNANGGRTVGSSCARSGGVGGLINVSSDILNVNSDVSSYGGRGRYGGSGGKIILDVKNIIIGGNINVYGGVGGDSRGGSAGSVLINSENLSVGLVRAYGGVADEYSGGRGGSLKINSDTINSLGTLTVYGGSSGRWSSGVTGGNIEINTKNSFVLPAINVNGGSGGGRNDGSGYPGGPGGSVNIKTLDDLFVNGIIYANGGTGGPGDDGGDGAVGGLGGKIYLSAKNLVVDAFVSVVGGTGGAGQKDGAFDYVRQGAGGSGGEIRLASENIITSVLISANGGAGRSGGHNTQGGSGGMAGKISIYSLDTQINELISAVGGMGAYGYTGWNGPDYCRCGSGGSGGKVTLFIDDTVAIDSFSFDVSGGGHAYYDCVGTCGVDGPDGVKRTHERTVNAGFRMFSTLTQLATTENFTGSIQLRVKDPITYAYVSSPKTFNAWSEQKMLFNGDLNNLFGVDDVLRLILGKTYILEVVLSDDLIFDSLRCITGEANCDIYQREINYYYGI
ncbi:hypothetical protein GQ473_03230 [archaeon]|nr:hypothetical protein [archaeon]